jgi:hypothetical protein
VVELLSALQLLSRGSTLPFPGVRSSSRPISDNGIVTSSK